MAENLKKTLLIEETEYNINAVYSDESGKVTNPLIVKESGTKVFDFDGDTSGQTINYVPSTGGKFIGPGPVLINENNYNVGNTGNDEIVNYGQIVKVVSNLQGNPLWSWDASAGYVEQKDENSGIYNISTVIGTVEDLPLFEAYATGEAHNKYIAPDSYDNAYITYGSTYCDAYFNQAYLDRRETITKLVFKGKVVNNQNVEKGLRIRAAEFTASSKANPPYGFLNLETVYINPGAIWIDNSAFKGCTNLITVDIPNSIEKIGKNAFEGCTKLTSIVLGNNLKEIQSGAFKDCTCLKSIAICKKEDVSIASDAFSGCTALKKVYFKGTQAEWKTLTSSNSLLNSLTVTTISDSAFPFLYICKADVEDTSLTSNKIFLKVPGEALVEVSKGAARLERRDSKTSGNVDYFTYDVLAAVIAGINSRITALGSQALALPKQLEIYDTDAKQTVVLDIPVNVASADDNPVIVEETVVPTVQQLQNQLTNLTGLNQNNDYANNAETPTPVRNALADDVGTTIKTGYYHVGMVKKDGNIVGNSIRILNYIPQNDKADAHYVEAAIGDICIVINTGDGEYK